MYVRMMVIGVVLGGVAPASFVPVPARACSCLRSSILQLEPGDRTTDMPLNAALIVSGTYEPGSLTVVNSRDEPADVMIDQGPKSTGQCSWTSAEIIPAQPWAARETYTVRAKPIYAGAPLEASFVTGDETMPEP